MEQGTGRLEYMKTQVDCCLSSVAPSVNTELEV